MMKRIVLISLAVFAVLFIIITFLKSKSSAATIEQEATTHTASEKEKVIRFWAIYREATDFRMDEQWEKAVEGYQRALELNDRHEDALYYLGNSFLELGRYKEAEETWIKLAEVNPRNSRAFLQLGNLYLSSKDFFDINKAETACQEALRINKEETGPLVFLGEINLIRGNIDEAAADFKRVTNSNFKSTEAYFLGGYIAWKKGDLKHARDLYIMAVKTSKPPEASSNKVVGEGDTKHGKGFGSVTSKSVFNSFIKELPAVDPEHPDQALDKAYHSVDSLLAELKSRLH